MSNLQLRVVSAIVLAAIVLGLTWIGGWPFRILAAAIGALVFYEWITVSKVTADRPLAAVSCVVVTVALGALVVGVDVLIVLAFAVVPAVIPLLVGGSREAGPIAGRGMLYALLPAVALAALRGDDRAGLVAMIYLFAVVWATDILAYFVGRAIGGPKLAPSISPGKTWSGAIGGAVAGVVAGVMVAVLAGVASPVLLGALALVLSVVSQIGDLFESAFKRRHQVKDSSQLIPGHGGVMDRVDGLVAAAVALYLAGWALTGDAAMPSAVLFAS